LDFCSEEKKDRSLPFTWMGFSFSFEKNERLPLDAAVVFDSADLIF